MIWNNVLTAHHRWMANYLRRRNWVVFYLDEYVRNCNCREMLSDTPHFCWLEEYQRSVHSHEADRG